MQPQRSIGRRPNAAGRTGKTSAAAQLRVARRNRRLRAARPAERPTLGGDALARDARLAKLEALLLLAREPLSTRKLAQWAGLADGTEARTLIRRLNRLYDGGGSAFRAEEVGGGFQLFARARFGPWLRRLYQSPIEVRLSPPTLETLAIVAYRQPVMRGEIDAVRGVDCSEILRQLMERQLVRITGRSSELGRPYYYGTTRRFLQVFGLRSLEDLPRAAELRGTGSPAPGKTPRADRAAAGDRSELPEKPQQPENATHRGATT